MKATGKLSMSHFKNKQGLLIRTYAAEVDKPKGSAILVHGNKSHFRADFTNYNVDFYKDKYGLESVDPNIVIREMHAIYPNVDHKIDFNNDYEFHYSKLDGKNALDITPRFTLNGSIVEYLNGLGYSAYGLDLQSQGMSQGHNGHRNYFKKFDDHVVDVIQFIDIIRRNKFHNVNEEWDPNVLGKNYSLNKCFLMGLSMGGNVVLRAAQIFKTLSDFKSNIVDGIVCFAPMLDIDMHFSGAFNQLALAIAKMIVTFCHHSTFMINEKYEIDTLNSFLRVNDPYYITKTQTHKAIVSLLEATRTLEKNHSKYPVDMPTLVFHCKDDNVCDFKGSKKLVETHLKHINSIKLVELDGKTHCITLPSMNTRIFDDLKKWLASINQ
ncbi:bifunctional Alpha-Beta hydrolase fold/Serine aminopeptidase [Babesia duncani]|uniref:Bifunctional Alpha-Beta hydrolase fold/Serine aminopeptidase n=1 Tax=Babesia duncani TaxID=323732 RepID=A0AAD9PJZ0_9APIC|nr:bifunctional Alpha-Beta hydrolase fold/Serine aminopeptidase [Babesia duncani]